MTQMHYGRTIRCGHCGFDFPATAPGTRYRNHCPVCLWSRHLDAQEPGDRAAGCGGLMEPIAVAPRPDGEWTLVHRCLRCAALGRNRIAGDDDPLALMALAVRPLARPPFPLTALLPVQPGLAPGQGAAGDGASGTAPVHRQLDETLTDDPAAPTQAAGPRHVRGDLP